MNSSPMDQESTQDQADLTGSVALGDNDDDVVTPWNVSSKSATGVDYEKLIVRFGSERIREPLLKRFETVTGVKPHHLLRRGIFFSHRDFEYILKSHEAGQPIYLYTGRGPSSSAMHVGHLLPFIMTVWLQKTFNCPVVIQLTDDEKWACKPDEVNEEQVRKFVLENSRDIIACGFDLSKTLIFSNLGVMRQEINLPRLLPVAWDIGIKTTNNKMRGIFGFSGEDNTAKNFFPNIQAAPAFSCTFSNVFGLSSKDKPMPCLIPCGIDQDPFFRLTRDVAQRLGHPKPALLHSKFFPALQGAQTKMSASVDISAVFLTDTPNQIKNKINKYAFSGGGATVEEHKANGGNCDIDIAFQYLVYFLEDDERLETIRQRYSSGEMLTGELKKETIGVVQRLVAEHQARRAQVTDELVRAFMQADRFPRRRPSSVQSVFAQPVHDVPKGIEKVSRQTDCTQLAQALESNTDDELDSRVQNSKCANSLPAAGSLMKPAAVATPVPSPIGLDAATFPWLSPLIEASLADSSGALTKAVTPKTHLSWHEYFMSVAHLAAMRSKDPTTKVGACIVNQQNKIVATGYNGMPNGVGDNSVPWVKEGAYLETKYAYVVHAELNAILNCILTDQTGCRLYVSLFPCNECAKAIIQAGIRHVIYLSDKNKHKESTKAAKIMFKIANVLAEEYGQVIAGQRQKSAAGAGAMAGRDDGGSA